MDVRPSARKERVSPPDNRTYQKPPGHAAGPAGAWRIKTSSAWLAFAAFAFLSTAMPAAAFDMAKLTPPQAAYYRCMLERAAEQGRQYDGIAWLAVKAARADCAAQRKILHADLAAEAAAAGTLFGDGRSGETAADAALGAFDDAIWPDLIRVIEAK